MGLEALTFTSVEPYVDGYEQCTGTAVLALEPGSEANQVIVDLDRAARDHDGLVRFETDVVLLRAPHHSDLLHVVANRGMVTTLPYGVGLPMAEASGSIDPGDEWVLTRGLSVLWVGWQWDVDRRPGAVGLEAPEARADDGGPLCGQARLGFQPLVDAPRRRLADLVLPLMGQFQALPAADLDEHAAVLSERTWFNGPRSVIDRDRWRFADDEHIELDGGFRARTHYELTYTTRRCPVTGAGLAAVRDVVSHLPHAVPPHVHDGELAEWPVVAPVPPRHRQRRRVRSKSLRRRPLSHRRRTSGRVQSPLWATFDDEPARLHPSPTLLG